MRKTRIGTVSFLVDDEPHTIERNIRRGLDYIDEAAALGCDIVCLPEFFHAFNVPAETSQWKHFAEPVPGPLSETISAKAVEHGMHIVANWPVMEGDKVYNQTNFFDRDGKIAGIYRKAQLTVYEYMKCGVIPGDELPVFELDFGRVACITCMDIYFPEIVRIYSLKGAEIVFWPTMASGPSEYNLETQLCARAMDYSVYMVQSNYSMAPPYAPYAGRARPGHGCIIDHDGRIIADTGHRPGIAFADIDLDEPRLTMGCVGISDTDRMKADINRIVRLDLYAREFAELDKVRDRVY